MKELLEKAVLTGIGVFSMTKEKVEEWAKKVTEEAKFSEEEGKKFMKNLMDQSEKARKNLEAQVDKLVKKALDKYEVATRDELEKLDDRIKKLEKSKAKK